MSATRQGLALAVLNSSPAAGDLTESRRAWLGDLTLTWSRFGYREPIVAGNCVDRVLAELTAGTARYAFVQWPGNLLHERWLPDGSDLLTALTTWCAERELLVAGWVSRAAAGWYRFEERCLMVDLERYAALGRPAWGQPLTAVQPLPAMRELREQGRLTGLLPRPGATEQHTCRHCGWGLIAASARAGLPVAVLPGHLRAGMLSLVPHDASAATALDACTGAKLAEVDLHTDSAALDPEQLAFLRDVADQVRLARQGVFVWNIEAYHDVEDPPPGAGPVSTLFSVAAGFKPNRILETHGFDPATRVVYFDYSPNALAVRRALHDDWDGRDLPAALRELFRRFPHPETFYQLWHGQTPDALDWDQVAERWREELDCWGGAASFAANWAATRRLKHEFVCCDITEDAARLLTGRRPGPRAVVWWSNAFFTVRANWLHSTAERRRAYLAWIDALAACDPDLALYGSDYANANVNHVQAGEYRRLLAQTPHDALRPFTCARTELRM